MKYKWSDLIIGATDNNQIIKEPETKSYEYFYKTMNDRKKENGDKKITIHFMCRTEYVDIIKDGDIYSEFGYNNFHHDWWNIFYKK